MAQKNIHPKYFVTTVTCTTCQEQFKSGTTKGEEIRVESCSKCHPFYTGKQTFMSSKGQVDVFNKRLEAQKVKIKESESTVHQASKPAADKKNKKTTIVLDSSADLLKINAGE